MQIQNLEFNDYMFYRSEIRKLLIDSYFQDFQLSCEQTISMIDKKLDDLDAYIKTNAFVIGAINDGNLIAFAWIYQYNEDGEERFHFNDGIVNSDWRGMGIGEKITQKAIEIVKEAGVKVIDSMVAEENVASRKLSEKKGFTTNKRYLVKRLKSE